MGNMIRVAEVSDLPVGGVKKVSLEDVDIAIFNIGGELYAIGDTCTHEQASLSEGDLDGDNISCARHGATFNIKTGEVVALPAVMPVPIYRVKVEGKDILLEVPDDK
ncbi:MAG TPA: non-heme iron oxygenase ferredoxin subunit [Nitrospiria bacterium]|nr:non-heme iron oxygenase ferredoxin subunit [Nitrospiria bacterium]